MKILFTLLFVSLTFVNAATLKGKIQNIIGYEQYAKHSNLINSLTKNKQAFYAQGKISYAKILSMLSRNGLLKLKFKTPQEVNITFEITNNPVKTIKILRDTLGIIGYSYYFTNSISKKENKTTTVWKIKFQSEYMLDPYVFNEELERLNARIVNLTKLSTTSWKYRIDAKNATLLYAKKIRVGEVVKLRKPLRPYILEVKAGASKLKVTSQRLNAWHPNIAFFDKKLNAISAVYKEKKYKVLEVSIPKNTHYIKLNDNYSLSNIRRGLTILVR